MLDFLGGVLTEHGAVAAMLVIVCILFYSLIWKVWDRAMTAKDEEIKRLVDERNRYQELVFERLLSSKFDEPDDKPSEKGAG